MPAEEILVRVDDKDNQVGTDTRENCHLGSGLRHRAYVVFLFHRDRLLLQMRSWQKLLWPGYWDVSYTSHVYPGETYLEAALRRGVQELGVKPMKLKEVLAFTYEAPFGRYSENEYCKLLVGEFDGNYTANPAEINETKFVTLEGLRKEMRREVVIYTPWLRLAFEGFLRNGASRKYMPSRE
jgi:isopentenyl-diphosphate delta-isomerase